jgi:hypothetical protein
METEESRINESQVNQVYLGSAKEERSQRRREGHAFYINGQVEMGIVRLSYPSEPTNPSALPTSSL